MSHKALKASPSVPSTTPLAAHRGRAVPVRRAVRFADTPSQIATSANTSVTTATTMPRRRLPSPSMSPIRLSKPSEKAASARWRTAGSGGGSCRAGMVPRGFGPRPPGGSYLAIDSYSAPFPWQWWTGHRGAPVTQSPETQGPGTQGPRTQGPARLLVLVSGEGTNLQALIDASRDPGYG